MFEFFQEGGANWFREAHVSRLWCQIHGMDVATSICQFGDPPLYGGKPELHRLWVSVVWRGLHEQNADSLVGPAFDDPPPNVVCSLVTRHTQTP